MSMVVAAALQTFKGQEIVGVTIKDFGTVLLRELNITVICIDR